MALTADEEKIAKAMVGIEALKKQVEAINSQANTDKAAKQTEIEAIESARSSAVASVAGKMATLEGQIESVKDSF